MVRAITRVSTKKPAPYKAPTLYDTPSFDPEATIAVTTSPAPFANARRVTPASASLNFKYLERYTMAGATYSSIVEQMNLKRTTMRKAAKIAKIIFYP